MSLTGQNIPVKGASSASANLSKSVSYMAYLGPAMVAYRRIIASSFNNTSVNFTCNPPSPQTIWDRNNILIEQPVTLDFTGTAPTSCLLQSGYDAFRAHPVMSVARNVELGLNGSTFNLEADEVVHEIMRFRGTDETLSHMSESPVWPDQSQQYSEMELTNRNPLSQYGEKSSGVPFRGGFPYTSITNTSGTGVAQVVATLTEPLMVSPAIFGSKQEKGLCNVQNATVNINWSGNLARMWSHSSGGNTLTAITVTMGEPAILCRYLTPSPLRSVPKSLNYAMERVEIFRTDRSGAGVAVGTPYSMTSNNLQLSVIPTHLMIFAKEKRGDWTYAGTDAWQSIEGLTINFANNSGILSGASKQQLYAIARENGINQSWSEWSGEPMAFASGSSEVVRHGVAGPLLLRMGKDIAFADPSLAPGVPGQYNLQVTINLVNRNPVRAIAPTLYIVAFNAGVVTLENNQTLQQLQPLSQADVLAAAEKAEMDGVPDEDGMLGSVSGGNIFGDIKEGFEKALPYIRKGRSIGQTLAGLAEGPAAAFGPEAVAGVAGVKSALDAAEKLGLGKKGMKGKKTKKGGVLIGGKQLSRAQLQRLQMGSFQ